MTSLTSHKYLSFNILKFAYECSRFLNIHLHNDAPCHLSFIRVILCQHELKHQQLLILLAKTIRRNHCLNVVVIVQQVRVDTLSENELCQHLY